MQDEAFMDKAFWWVAAAVALIIVGAGYYYYRTHRSVPPPVAQGRCRLRHPRLLRPSIIRSRG